MICVGLDVSKGKSTVVIAKPFGEVLEAPYDVTHDLDSLNKLTIKLKNYNDEVRVVMEATGAYHLPILTFLMKKEIFCSVINPLVMKRYGAQQLRKIKTDKNDSITAANYGFDNWHALKRYEPLEEVYDQLKIFGRQYNHYMKMKVESKQSLSNILDRVMPGIKKMFQNGSKSTSEKDKLADFVDRFWHYDNISKYSKKQFINMYNHWATKKGYHQDANKAQEIYALATNGITTLPCTPSTKMLVHESIRVLLEVNRTLVLILSQMNEWAEILPEYNVVMGLKGVGQSIGPRLIAEIGDVRKFHSGSALVAYAGIDAPPFQSGQFKATNRKISKRGSATLRKIAFEVMNSLKKTKPIEDNAVYMYILKKESEGKHKKVAKVAGINKFLRIYYARVMEVYK